MRHLLALPFACIMLTACAAPGCSSAHAITLAPGESRQLPSGATLRFDEVEDSRCPPGVRCVWAGKLSCRFSLAQDGAAPESFTLSPGEAAHVSSLLGGARLALDEASLPAPAAPDTPPKHRVTVKLLP